MSDEMTRLDEIESRLGAATPAPWEASGTVVAAMTGPGECGGCSGVLGGPAHEPACLWSEIAGADEPDAELIAHAPADLAALLAVVREVAGLHQPCRTECLNPQHEADCEAKICKTCDHIWPCPTGRALEALTETTEEKT